MNAAFLVPFGDALFAAIMDASVERNGNLLNLVYDDCEDDAPHIYNERPDGSPEHPIPSKYVVFDIPLGGKSAYVHGTDGDSKGEWLRFQANAWAVGGKRASLQVMDAVIQAIDGRDLYVSEHWGTVRMFKRGGVHPLEDVIADVLMQGAFSRYEVLLLNS